NLNNLYIDIMKLSKITPKDYKSNTYIYGNYNKDIEILSHLVKFYGVNICLVNDNIINNEDKIKENITYIKNNSCRKYFIIFHNNYNDYSFVSLDNEYIFDTNEYKYKLITDVNYDIDSIVYNLFIKR